MISEKTVSLFKSIARLWEPRPEMTVSQWADKYRVLTSETSPEPGPWRTDRAPYMCEVMDAVSDRETEEVAIMASAQVGKTEFMLNMVGFHIDYDPAPILFVLPNKDLIESFSKNRLVSMIKASPSLRKKVVEARGRDATNTISEKNFPGGYISIVGANSPTSLSSRPIRIVLCDEVDRYPASSGKEGDPITLATNRTKNFNYNRKHVFVSTPLIEETSRIKELYEDSTAEEWSYPCPHCGEYQAIKMQHIEFEYDKTESGEFLVKKVACRCKDCGFDGTEKEWKRGEGKWIAQKEHSYRRGFHLNQLVSPWSNWFEVVREFLIAKRDGPEKLKSFTNTFLGETWEEIGEKLEEEELLKRCEGYEADVPEGVKVLTAAVDVQDDRFEIEVKGWGVGKESWGIEYHTIFGDLKQPKIWNDLDEYLSRTWTNVDGQSFGIACTCIDSGGHYTTEVYRFVGPRESRKIFAIKGQGSANGQYIPLLNGYSLRKRYNVHLFNIGVDEGKGKVMSRLKINEQGPGYCHFPIGKGYNRAFFEGLTAEKLVKTFQKGVKKLVWKKVRERNEPFDLAVYNTAALEILNPNLDAISPGVALQKRTQKSNQSKRFVKKTNIW